MHPQLMLYSSKLISAHMHRQHSISDSQTVALFVHRCMCVVDDDLQAQRA